MSFGLSTSTWTKTGPLSSVGTSSSASFRAVLARGDRIRGDADADRGVRPSVGDRRLEGRGGMPLGNFCRGDKRLKVYMCVHICIYPSFKKKKKLYLLYILETYIRQGRFSVRVLP